MKLYIVNIFVFIDLCWGATTPQKNDTQPRIFGGYDAERYEYPFIVSYQVNYEHICGGSILTRTWVLTAAHCTIGTVRNTVIVAGLLNQQENHADNQYARITEQILHPDYIGGTSPCDIALVRLRTPLKWSLAVQSVYLPRENQEHVGLAWIAGWGFLSTDIPVPSITLQNVQMGIMPLQTCERILVGIVGHSGNLDDSMICTGGLDTGKETVCTGDSGGPLVQNGVLIGVNSWGVTPCGRYGAPSVFTKVSRFISWIRYYIPEI